MNMPIGFRYLRYLVRMLEEVGDDVLQNGGTGAKKRTSALDGPGLWTLKKGRAGFYSLWTHQDNPKYDDLDWFFRPATSIIQRGSSVSFLLKSFEIDIEQILAVSKSEVDIKQQKQHPNKAVPTALLLWSSTVCLTSA